MRGEGRQHLQQGVSMGIDPEDMFELARGDQQARRSNETSDHGMRKKIGYET